MIQRHAEQYETAAHSSRDIPTHVRVHPLVRLFIWGAALAIVVTFLDTFSFVVLLLLAAGCVAALLAPVRNAFPGPQWLRGSVVGVLFAVALAGIFALLGWLLSKPLRAEAAQREEIVPAMNAQLASWMQQLGFRDAITVEEAGRQVLSWLTGTGGDVLAQILSGAGAILIAVALFVFGLIYLLSAQNERIVRQMQRLLPEKEDNLRAAFQKLAHRLRWWSLGTLVSMTVTGVLTGLGFWLIGLQSAATLAVLAGLSAVVPTIGAAFVFLLSLIVAASTGDGSILGVVIVWVVVQTVESYIVVPITMRKAISTPPIITLATIVLWGRLLGPLGLIMALPLNLAIWTAIEEFYLERRRESASEGMP